jgi:hypothetical protein
MLNNRDVLPAEQGLSQGTKQGRDVERRYCAVNRSVLCRDFSLRFMPSAAFAWWAFWVANPRFRLSEMVIGECDTPLSGCQLTPECMGPKGEK